MRHDKKAHFFSFPSYLAVSPVQNARPPMLSESKIEREYRYVIFVSFRDPAETGSGKEREGRDSQHSRVESKK